MGRPTKRTPSTEERIIEAIRQGMTYRLAAQYAGIAYETLRSWLKAGEDGDVNFSAFVQSVRQAEADGAMANLAYINKSPDWRARAWVLEHRHPEEYGAKAKLELSGDPERPLVPTVINVIAPHSASNTDDD
jgi:hypothetical protein